MNAQQQEAAQQQQGGGSPVSSSPPRPIPPAAAAREYQLVAPERGQKPPMPPMRGARKGNAQDALAFFGGGFQKR